MKNGLLSCKLKLQFAEKGGFFMFNNKPRAVPIGNAYRRKCGKVTFIVSSFGNPDTKQTADDLILSMLKNKVKERKAV